MTAAHTHGPARSSGPTRTPGPARRGGLLLLRVTMLAVLVMPSYMHISPLGAAGNVAHLLALALAGIWVAASAFGLHDPRRFSHPGRFGLMIWVMVSAISAASLFAGFSGGSDPFGRSSAERWMMLLVASAGIVLVTAEAVRSREDLLRLFRWIMAGSIVCSLAAVAEALFHVQPQRWLIPLMAGFSEGDSGASLMERSGFFRVSGTTIHPIELATVTATLLPLAVWWALSDKRAGIVWRWAAPVLLVVANVLAVSRSGLVGMAVAVAVLIIFLPRTARRWAFILAPVGLVGIFLAVPGYIGSMLSWTRMGNDDPSISYRTSDYPLAWKLFLERPWLGQGPATWMPADARDIFDNQYILTVTTMGAIGLAALLIYFVLPLYGALQASRHAPDDESRLLAGAVAAALLVGVVSAATFDAFSFQTFVFVHAFVVGLSGLVWFTAVGEVEREREAHKRSARRTDGRSARRINRQTELHGPAGSQPEATNRTEEGTPWTR